ncbi:MAG TPA: GxxExxY protein [Kofleriaceae bacterium]
MNRQNRQSRQTSERILVEPSEQADRRATEVIGAAIEVHRVLGPGFLETVYEEALCLELSDRAIPFERQVRVGIPYKARVVGESRLDLLVDNAVLVELKAVDSIAPIHRAQVISYLRATSLDLGLLLNFNVRLLPQGLHRIVRSF